MVACAVFAAIQAPGVVDALAASGAELSALVEAADAHIGAEIVARWPAASRDVGVCLDVWRRLVHPAHGERRPAGKTKRACRGHNQMSSWAKALCWAASAGFEGWDACAGSLLDEAESTGGLSSLLGALRHLSQFGPKDLTAPRWRPKQTCEQEKVERLPVALRQLLTHRYAASRDGDGSGEGILEGILQGTAGISMAGDGFPPATTGAVAVGGQGGAAQDGGAHGDGGEGAILPWASLEFEPSWVATAVEVSALHADLVALIETNEAGETDEIGYGARGRGRLRIGIDTEWVDGEE